MFARRLTRTRIGIISVILSGIALVWIMLAAMSDGAPRAKTVPLPIARGVRGIPTPVELDVVGHKPGGASAASALVMVQGLADRRLVYWPMGDEDEPQEIDRHVQTWPVLASPNGRYVFYTTETTAMIFDTVARRAIIAGEYESGDFVWSAQWSPDSSAIVYVVQTTGQHTAYFVPADGRQRAEVMNAAPTGLYLDVAWLRDGRPATIHLGMGTTGGLEATYQLYDPDLGELLPLPPDVKIIQTWQPWRSPDGTQQVYTMQEWNTGKDRRGCNESPLGLADDAWLYLTAAGFGAPRKAAFEIEGVYLDRPTWLDNERVLFRGIADAVCTKTPTGLYIGTVGSTPDLLVEAGPPYNMDDTTKVSWSVSYALSPDRTLIAWSDNHEELMTSFIHLAALDGSSTETLYTTPPPRSGPPFFYRDSQMILYFIWLP